jgi:DNA topoisomerase-1
VLALRALRQAPGFESEAESKRIVVAAIDTVAHRLGHTRAVCRRSYIHPTVIERYLDRTLQVKPGLTDEGAVLTLLRRKAA